jgi:hypothetical protein
LLIGDESPSSQLVAFSIINRESPINNSINNRQSTIGQSTMGYLVAAVRQPPAVYSLRATSL